MNSLQKKGINLDCDNFFNSNKYPLLITTVFLIINAYVAFYINTPPDATDEIAYYLRGKEILSGHGENVFTGDAPAGGPVLFAILGILSNDVLSTIQLISLLCGTGIVFLSYFIIKNIFQSKIALLGQLVVAINANMHFLSTHPTNDILPVFLIFISLYYVTKKEILTPHLIIASISLGISFMIRYQALFIFLGLVIFLIIRDKNINRNLKHIFLFILCFVIGSSPLLIYNYTTFGKLIDGDANYYMATVQIFQNPEWKQELGTKIANNSAGPFEGILIDPGLFLKNYFYNLFFNNPNRLFNFSFDIGTISPTPPIPFLGAIIILTGVIYYLKSNITKQRLFVVISVAVILSIIIILSKTLETHFFAIVILPLILLGIISIRTIKKNFLPLLILPVVYMFLISIVPITEAYAFFPIWLFSPIFTSIFLLELVPRIISKNKIHYFNNKNSKLFINIIVIILISLLILVNLGFSYKLLLMIYFGDYSYEGISGEISKLFNRNDSLYHRAAEVKKIGKMLSLQPNIENSYIMVSDISYTYYANSKSVSYMYREGNENQTLNSFVNREGWSAYDLFKSSTNSQPPDRNIIYHPKPDYIIYEPLRAVTTIQKPLQILGDPSDPRIPSNFEFFFKSNKTGAIIYKIHHD